jgi:hypothetical protein
MSQERHPRTIRLPFGFGDTVYHRVRREKVPGMVTAYIIEGGQTQIRVRWDNMDETVHQFFELATEFTPSFED